MGSRAAQDEADGAAARVGEAVARACGASGRRAEPGELGPLFVKGAQVLVACSGGADSTALASAMCEVARAVPGLSLRISLGHVDHGLRAESAGEAEQVRALAASLGVPFFLETLDDAALREAIARDGLEGAARDFRYRALERLAAQAGCAQIATAHTRRDQAETVLLRLARGGGLGALAGVRRSRALGHVELVRPLLEVSRRATESLCRARGLSYTEDPHNRDPQRSRARVRQALNGLADLLNPRLEQALAASARIAAEEDQLLDQLARTALVSALETHPDTARLIPDAAPAYRLEPLAALPDVLLRRAILLAAVPAGARPERRHLEQLCALVRIGHGFIDVAGARAAISQGTLRFQTRNTQRSDGSPVRSSLEPLRVAAAGLHAWGAWLLDVRELEASGPALREPGSPEETTGELFVDLSLAPFPWTLRAAAPGDRFRPARGRSKKVSELWIDARVPREERLSLPLLADAHGKLFFVSGLRPGAAAVGSGKVSDSHRCVSLRFRREEGASFRPAT